MERVPVVVVAGFLGAGKTTLLNHLLRGADGLRIGVVVNDFGRVNIDAMTVAAQVDSTVTLGNGCLCCAIDVSDLDEMLGRLAAPDGPVDVIVIEASGLAEPPAMVRMVLASENPRVVYGGLVEVVDAAEFEAVRERHPQLDKHLRYADLVLLNKVDRVDAERRERLLALVRDLADGVPVVATEQGRVDPALLFDPARRPGSRHRQLTLEDLRADLAGEEPHVHAGYESVEFVREAGLNPVRLAAFLAERPAGLYRLKGTVRFDVAGHGQRFTLQTVGGYVRLHRDSWPPGEPRETRLVLIGAGLDAPALTAALESTIETTPDAVDPLEMASMTRYLAD